MTSLGSVRRCVSNYIINTRGIVACLSISLSGLTRYVWKKTRESLKPPLLDLSQKFDTFP
ncbi:hypothetical protein BS47DRAFT_346078 [Hydnum rufescens UP504]|uniref:Uncharacterized protein n=1 Tax=Hydnum rufescens UP504 TaxID=1448309 RepID=A0A9P6AKD7_9AGAM|nr:hypothetical protein BS47DRAFT_346078 [Hydnum rufescens UP504]